MLFAGVLSLSCGRCALEAILPRIVCGEEDPEKANTRSRVILVIDWKLPKAYQRHWSTFYTNLSSSQAAGIPLSIRHPGVFTPFSPLPKTPLFFSPGSPTRKTFPHFEAS